MVYDEYNVIKFMRVQRIVISNSIKIHGHSVQKVVVVIIVAASRYSNNNNIITKMFDIIKTERVNQSIYPVESKLLEVERLYNSI